MNKETAESIDRLMDLENAKKNLDTEIKQIREKVLLEMIDSNTNSITLEKHGKKIITVEKKTYEYTDEVKQKEQEVKKLTDELKEKKKDEVKNAQATIKSKSTYLKIS